MGRLKALIPFVLAVAVSLTAAIFIYNLLKQKGSVPAPVATVIPQDMTQIVLASADLAWGTKIAPEMLKKAPIGKDDTPPGSFPNPADLEGRVLVVPVKQNEPIIESKLASKDVTTGGVSAVVSQGKRAIAVAGDKVIGLAGFIQPGNHVDILVTVQDPQNDKLHFTTTVLEDILVLATGTLIDNKDSSKPAPVDVFTVEVTPEQGQKLSLAATQGRLHFALRNVTDKDEYRTLGSTVTDMLDSYRPRMQQVAEPAAKMEPGITGGVQKKVSRMDVINGTTIQTVSF